MIENRERQIKVKIQTRFKKNQIYFKYNAKEKKHQSLLFKVRHAIQSWHSLSTFQLIKKVQKDKA